MAKGLAGLLAEIRACRRCVEAPIGAPLGHQPRPVIRAAATARIVICGQAPGTRVHDSGVPFLDPSGDRLRAWMSVTSDEFYDESRVAIVPMGSASRGSMRTDPTCRRGGNARRSGVRACWRRYRASS